MGRAAPSAPARACPRVGIRPSGGAVRCVPRAAEAEVAGRAVGRVRAAGRRPGSGSSTSRGRGTSRPASPAGSRCAGPAGCAAWPGDVERRVEPVGAPLPDVAGDVVEAVAVGRERVDGARCRGSRRRACCASGNVPCQTFMRCSPPGVELVAPGIALLLQAAARRVLPLGLGRQALAGPAAVGAARRSRRRADRVVHAARRCRSAGLRGGASRRRRPAATTARPTTARRRGWKSSGSRPANTNDQPNRSASVT